MGFGFFQKKREEREKCWTALPLAHSQHFTFLAPVTSEPNCIFIKSFWHITFYLFMAGCTKLWEKQDFWLQWFRLYAPTCVCVCVSLRKQDSAAQVNVCKKHLLLWMTGLLVLTERCHSLSIFNQESWTFSVDWSLYEVRKFFALVQTRNIPVLTSTSEQPMTEPEEDGN